MTDTIMRETVTIESNSLRIEISPYGAELMSIRDSSEDLQHPVEYLWQGNPNYWGGRAPVLFPYIARLTNGRYQLNGKEYRMNTHGFAKDSLFEIAKQQQNSVTPSKLHKIKIMKRLSEH